MAALSQGNYTAQHAHPDHEVSSQLFTPGNRAVDHEAEKNLDQDGEGHGQPQDNHAPRAKAYLDGSDQIYQVRDTLHAMRSVINLREALWPPSGVLPYLV